MSADERPDPELLAAAAQGDGTAFAVLVRRYIRAATLLAAQVLGDPDEAEDIVQDAFTVVYRKARHFDAKRPFSPWFFAIVRRLAANRRARNIRRQRLLRWWGKRRIAPEESSSPDAGLLARLDAAAARSAMDDLSPMQRACFELVVLKELSIGEVAAMHQISPSTVRQHVFRARTALRAALERNHA